MQNQTNRKHFSNPEDIFKSAKNPNLNPNINLTLKRTPLKLPYNNTTFARI